MSYLKIPLFPAVNGQTSVIIQKKDIISVLAVNATSTIININSGGIAAEDVLTLTHTAAAATYNVADMVYKTLGLQAQEMVLQLLEVFQQQLAQQDKL